LIAPAKPSAKTKRPGGFAVDQRLEHHIVAALRFRRPVPGPVKRNEGTIFVGGRKLTALIDQHGVGRPMRRERCYWRLLLRADAHGLSAIATIFRGQHELVLDVIVVAFRPAEIGALPQLDQPRPAGWHSASMCKVWATTELVPAMLLRKPCPRIEGNPLAVAETRDEAFRGRERIHPVGVIAPGAGSALTPRKACCPAILDAILALARIGGRSQVDVEVALGSIAKDALDDRPSGNPDRTVSGAPVGSIPFVGSCSARCGRSSRHRRSSCRSRRRFPQLPSALVGPKRTILSAWPSPLVSCSATRNPPGGGVSLW
jgi:hypothetical protein